MGATPFACWHLLQPVLSLRSFCILCLAVSGPRRGFCLAVVSTIWTRFFQTLRPIVVSWSLRWGESGLWPITGGCVTSGKRLAFSEPQFQHLYGGWIISGFLREQVRMVASTDGCLGLCGHRTTAL